MKISFKILLNMTPWVLISAWLLYAALTPASYWMEVKKIYVHDTVIGDDIPIAVDWIIHRPFVANWHTVLRKSVPGDQSSFVAICTSDGQANMFNGRQFPKDITLGWWMGQTHCELTPGAYYLETIWTWEELGVHRSIVVDSNVFKLTEAD